MLGEPRRVGDLRTLEPDNVSTYIQQLVWSLCLFLVKTVLQKTHGSIMQVSERSLYTNLSKKDHVNWWVQRQDQQINKFQTNHDWWSYQDDYWPWMWIGGKATQTFFFLFFWFSSHHYYLSSSLIDRMVSNLWIPTTTRMLSSAFEASILALCPSLLWIVLSLPFRRYMRGQEYLGKPDQIIRFVFWF